LAGFGEDFAGLVPDGSDEHDERVGLGDGQIERLEGGDGAFSDLAGGFQGKPGCPF